MQEPADTEANLRAHDSETRAGANASNQPAASILGQSSYVNAHEDDRDGNEYSDNEEDEYDQDEIFDDHNIEQYGRQGYGGWDWFGVDGAIFMVAKQDRDLWMDDISWNLVWARQYTRSVAGEMVSAFWHTKIIDLTFACSPMPPLWMR